MESWRFYNWSGIWRHVCLLFGAWVGCAFYANSRQYCDPPEETSVMTWFYCVALLDVGYILWTHIYPINSYISRVRKAYNMEPPPARGTEERELLIEAIWDQVIAGPDLSSLILRDGTYMEDFLFYMDERYKEMFGRGIWKSEMHKRRYKDTVTFNSPTHDKDKTGRSTPMAG